MKHTVTFYALEDDNRFQGHEFELVFDDEFVQCYSGAAFDTIRSVGYAPISTKLVSDYVENCFLAEKILEVIQDNSDHEVTLGDVEDVCNGIHNNPYVVLDTDYSDLEAA